MEKIRCQNCGALNDEDNIYCSSCEEILTNSAAGRAYMENENNKRKRRAKKLRFWGTVLGIFLIVIFAVGIIGGRYILMMDKVQGIWSGSEGDLILQTTGDASISHATFAPEGSYTWKFRLWDKLCLISEDKPGTVITYKVKVDSENDTLELTEIGNEGNVFNFRGQSMLIY